MFQPSNQRFTETAQTFLEFNSLIEDTARNLLGEVDLMRIAASLKQNQKRKGELGQFFTPAPVAELMAGMFQKLDAPKISLLDEIRIPLVMVTTFLSRKAMVEYLSEIAWETDVWVAEDATHLIHFNGEYLLQAYNISSNP